MAHVSRNYFSDQIISAQFLHSYVVVRVRTNQQAQKIVLAKTRPQQKMKPLVILLPLPVN